MFQGSCIIKTKYFDIGNTPCKLYSPDAGRVTLAVLAVHGFAGDKERSAIAALADALCPKGAAIYCFDFPAHGAHPSDDLTVAACRESLIDVAKRMQMNHATARKAVFATSFGGYMVLRCLDDLDNALGSFKLVLRAPAVKMADTFTQRIVGSNDIANLETGGSIECGFDRKIEIRKEFLDGLGECDVCAPHARQMLVIHGTEDDVVIPSDIDEFMQSNPLAELARVSGADHRFKGAGELDSVVDFTASYILPKNRPSCNDRQQHTAERRG